MRSIHLLFLFFVTSLTAYSVSAQFGPDTARLKARDRAVELVRGDQTTDMLLETVLQTKDIAYGVDERQKLDLYLPKEAAEEGELFPVVLFIHGGGFTAGDKADAADLGGFFASQKTIAIAANYRFPPENIWPSGARDIAAQIQWIQRNASEYGADPERIFLMGHSAGAGHVASYVFFEDFQVFEDGVAGAILVSGSSYELSLVLNEAGTALSSAGQSAYYGTDPSLYSQMSSINHLEGRKIPLLVAYAESDGANVQTENAALVQALYQRDGVLPSVVQGIGDDHMSIFNNLGIGKSSVVGSQILAFIKAH